MSIKLLRTRLQETIEQAVSCALGESSVRFELVFPPEPHMGDFALPCFPLAKQFRMSPAEISRKIANQIAEDEIIGQVQAIGPYLNFHLKNKVLFEAVCSNTEWIDSFGQGQRVMVEYLSPNTNKPLHLGHVRNGTLGMAISNILKAVGYDVVKANLVNDRGIHICKSMLAWLKWGNGQTPEQAGMKGDHFVGEWYVRYAKEVEQFTYLEEEAQDLLRRWEKGDSETIELWRTMNQWAYDGFDATYRVYGFVFDKFYYESDTYKLGRDRVLDGLQKGLLVRDDNGAVMTVLPIEEFGLDTKGNPRKVTLLRQDGTSVYMTQDIGTAKLKFDDFGLDRSIYVVGSEQNYHFQCLFKILEILGFPWAKECFHLSYGMVYLPEGKMKSREGKVVDADDLFEEMVKLAIQEIHSRNLDSDLSIHEIHKRAEKIALAAIKFYLLQMAPKVDIHFDPQSSISFDGCTGPYCQYTYARAFSILEKAKAQKMTAKSDFSLLGNDDERMLAQKLIGFSEQVERAAQELSPSAITSATYELARIFNQFYQKHSVLSASSPELSAARLALVKTTIDVLGMGLNLLGIDSIERM